MAQRDRGRKRREKGVMREQHPCCDKEQGLNAGYGCGLNWGKPSGVLVDWRVVV